ncbi:MAG: 4-hydroxythreonine-4-phosphate dehydrogenase PdxA [Sandaracinaceae bacterium]|nr:4-hydroxythreonine-4-phosphate dehydrogenase PdxA [Sandaracinaceae bacterium]
MTHAPLLVPVGDPAGVGPGVSITAAARAAHGDRVVLLGDAGFLARMATARGVGTRQLADVDEARVGELGLLHVASWTDAMVDAHAPSPAGGAAQLTALDTAITQVLAGRGRAVVTGPTSKEAIVSAGHPFVGQTERLAQRAGLHDDDVTMMFLGPRLCVALVTTHLALGDVPREVTAPRVRRATMHLMEALARAESARPLRVLVSGLNPHAGEHGLFGHEEALAIEPALRDLLDHPLVMSGAVVLEGPVPAEAAFRYASSGRAHGVVAMYHDQATIASKLLDWGSAVNVTWGLPFVRTSVDHGVAYDAARDDCAEDEGMVAAIEMAQRLTRLPVGAS